MTMVGRWSGKEARALREAKRMTIREFASHLGVSDRVISKWEAGGERIHPRPVNQAALDTSLARSGPEEKERFSVSLVSPSLDALPPLSAKCILHPMISCIPGHALPESDDMDRREPQRVLPTSNRDDGVNRGQFLGIAGRTLGMALLAPPLLLPVHDNSRARVDEEAIAALATEIEGHRWRDRRLGARTLLPTTLRRAHEITRLAMGLGDKDPHRLTAINAAADMTHLVGYQLFDQGQPGRASTWFQASAELAARAHDSDLYVFSQTGVADMSTQLDQPHEALALLNQLSQLRLSEAAKSYVAAYQAHAVTRQQDVDTALRLLDNAATHAERAAHQPPSSLIGIDHHTWIQRQRGLILTRANSPAAIPILEHLRNRTDSIFQRYHANVATDLAALHEDADEAANLLVIAARINATVNSTRRRERISTVLASLRQRGADRAVGRVEEELRARNGT